MADGEPVPFPSINLAKRRRSEWLVKPGPRESFRPNDDVVAGELPNNSYWRVGFDA